MYLDCLSALARAKEVKGPLGSFIKSEKVCLSFNRAFVRYKLPSLFASGVLLVLNTGKTPCPDLHTSWIDSSSQVLRSSLDQLVVDLSTQARQDLKVLILVEVLSLLDLGGVGSPLLLCLASLHPLLHGKMLVQLCEIVRSQTQAIEDGTLDWVQDDVVVWSGQSQRILCEGCHLEDANLAKYKTPSRSM